MAKRKLAILAALFLGALLGWHEARADEAMEWNAVAAAALSAEPSSLTSRVMAAMHVAVHDAVNSIEPRDRTYGFTIPVHMRASKDAAAASAAHDVLTAMLPEQKSILDAALASSLSKIPEGQAKRDGIGAGKAVARAVIASGASSADVLAEKLQ